MTNRASQRRQGAKLTSTTNGGRAKGIPRNVFTPLAVLPMKVPSSRMTVGLVAGIVGVAKTVAVMAQMETRNPRRRAMASKENSFRALRGAGDL